MFVALSTKGAASNGAIGSIIISAAAAGYTSASISFDLDVNPLKRKESPSFYGYIPDGLDRSVIFLAMMCNSSLLLLIRSISSALLLTVDSNLLLMYMVLDVSFYLFQKILRRDLHHWAPIEGVLGLVVAVMFRAATKIIIDFTAIIHFRGAGEHGGIYFTFSMFLSIIFAVASVALWSEQWLNLVVGLSSAWVFTFIVIIGIMKQDFRGSFFSTKTGRRDVMDRFESTNEVVKASILKKNSMLWWEIRPKVRQWVLANYWRWKEEKPEFFTESWLSHVPEDFVPKEEDRKMLRSVREKRLGRGRFTANATKVLAEARSAARVEAIA